MGMMHYPSFPPGFPYPGLSQESLEWEFPLTSSKKGLFPFRIRVLRVCPATVTFTTGRIWIPGSCRASMTLTRIWDGGQGNCWMGITGIIPWDGE